MEQNPLNRYAQRMADLYVDRSPVSTEVLVRFMKDPVPVDKGDQHFGDDSSLRDLYHDFVDQDSGLPGHMDSIQVIIKKKAIVKKEHPTHYVQFGSQETGFDTESLMQETDQQPWIVSMTITDLPRLPRTDDQIEIDGDLFTISEVLPANRKLDSLVNCRIYPEHSSPPPALELRDLILLPDKKRFSLICSGRPKWAWIRGLGGVNFEWCPYQSYYPRFRIIDFSATGMIKSAIVYVSDSKEKPLVSPTKTTFPYCDKTFSLTIDSVKYDPAKHSASPTGLGDVKQYNFSEDAVEPTDGWKSVPVIGKLNLKVPEELQTKDHLYLWLKNATEVASKQFSLISDDL